MFTPSLINNSVGTEVVRGGREEGQLTGRREGRRRAEEGLGGRGGGTSHSIDER